MKKNHIILSVLFVVLGVFACKDPEPPRAVITVKDENQVLVSGAKVSLTCVPAMDDSNTQECKEGLEQEGVTSADGIVEFEVPLPSVLKAEIVHLRTLTVDSVVVTDSLKGSAFVEFQKGEVTEQEITIYPL